MGHDKSLEERVEDVVVSYNALPWIFYPINWAANFPVRKLPGFENLPVPHRFIAKTKYNGKAAGRIARVKESDPDRASVYYRTAYDQTGGTFDNIVEWAEDTPREEQINDGNMTLDRKIAMTMSLHNGRRTISMIQHSKNLFDSWYALPFKMPFYLAMLPFNMLFGLGKMFGGRELVELGKLYSIENTGQPGDITLDQNLVRQYLTLGLGKYYDLRDQNNKVIVSIKRSPLLKLLTLGLKNRYKVRVHNGDEKLVKISYGLVDYIQNEFRFRIKKPSKSISVEDLFRYGT